MKLDRRMLLLSHFTFSLATGREYVICSIKFVILVLVSDGMRTFRELSSHKHVSQSKHMAGRHGGLKQ